MTRKRKRLVVKFGSGILTTPQGNALDPRQFSRLAAEIATVLHRGHQCVIVSSGAVAAGLNALGLEERPYDVTARQSCAAVGQPRLMVAYEKAFTPHGITVAQVLLTHGDIDSRLRSANARNTLDRILATRRVVPVINENDTVAVEELKFGDNDRLSAEVAMLTHADLLILLTSVDGLLDADGNVVPEVRNIDAVTRFVKNEKGRLAVGGMQTKLEAVRLAVNAGIPAVIASGRTAGVIPAILAGRKVGTRFPVTGS